MRIGFYLRLAVDNIKKNKRLYLPYMVTCMVTIMVYYMMKSLSLNPAMSKMYGGGYIAYILELGSHVIELFALIFLFYTNNFLMRQRKKEFGLYNILGMGKKHLAVVLFGETLIVLAVCCVCGLVCGMALDKAMYLLGAKIIGTEEITLGFFVSPKAVAAAFCLPGIVLLLLFVKNVLALGISKPIELLRGGSVGEKEPKAKWFLALLGAAMVGWAYYVALTTTNPLSALVLFFAAVVMVILGTYLLFTAGSITVLKLLRRNKRYYYRARHFISVSGMIYRMKQNAIGLANICILSTMVLVMVSTTTSLMVGVEGIIHNRFPCDIDFYGTDRTPQDDTNAAAYRQAEDICREIGMTVTGSMEYRYMLVEAILCGDTFLTDENAIEDLVYDGSAGYMGNLANVVELSFVPLSDYNRIAPEDATELGSHEALVCVNRGRYGEQTVHACGRNYTVREERRSVFGNGHLASNISTTYFVIVRDEEWEQIIQATVQAWGAENVEITHFFGLDLSGSEADRIEAANRIKDGIAGTFQGFAEMRMGQRASFMSLYGGLFFLGMFLGLLFIMATVLIIYYKQISEGYEDRERFVIMQKVGMTQAEVKSAIHSQVLTVFFLPLLMAGVHTTVAFPIVSQLLRMLNMMDTGLYLCCMVVCYLVFAVMYVLIYNLTAKTYYRIVRW